MVFNDIKDVFLFVLDIVATGFTTGWEQLFQIPIEWMWDMTLGDVVISMIGISMFASVIYDIIIGGTKEGNQALKRYRIAKRKDKKK